VTGSYTFFGISTLQTVRMLLTVMTQNIKDYGKMRHIFDIVNDAFSTYASIECLAVDEVLVLFKERVNFKQYIPKKHKCFGFKIYKLCDMSGYTYDMDVYFGKNKTCATADVTSTHATDM
jgi:hypothetical protein